MLLAKWNYSLNPLLPDMLPATKNNNDRNNITRAGGWGARESGRAGERVLRTTCHHPFLMAKSLYLC